MTKDSLCCKVYLSRIEETNDIFQIEIRCSNKLYYIFMTSLLNVLKIPHTTYFPYILLFLKSISINIKTIRRMEYSKEFLKEFEVNTGQTYIVVPVDGKLHEVPLRRKNTNKKYFAMVRAEESPIREFQCSAIECDFKHLNECIGCRCLPGGRKDNKAVVFKIEYIYQKS